MRANILLSTTLEEAPHPFLTIWYLIEASSHGIVPGVFFLLDNNVFSSKWLYFVANILLPFTKLSLFLKGHHSQTSAAPPKKTLQPRH